MKRTSSGKVDRGFALAYWDLSYRRKMLRTLWGLPLTAVIPLIPYQRSGPLAPLYSAVGVWGLTVIVFLSFVGQFVYNFVMWRRHEQDGESALQ